ncbi:carboxypeptidase regulatory-like domain-containing protein [Salinibacter ruber]|uniref:carboxypeptidase regulatory-like domain-containing protein n=1 Tax=Salinibacter ruber TaxID=146919 RepID=UPI000E58246C|nr:carboxypeptidase regulatory-like domain-containing protein [Salinibacter ruber]
MSKLQNWSNTLVLLIATLGFGLVVSGCDSGGTSPDSNNLGDVSGAITGQVIDNATSNPIEGAKVVVAVGSLDTDGKSFSATTGSEGRFAITDLPATTADDGSEDESEDPSAKYGIRVETPDGSAYRDAYRGQVELAYGNNETGAVELGANITFPLQKNNGSLSGQLGVDGSDAPLRNTELRASQTINTGFTAEGDAKSGELTVTTTTTTDGQGSFTFENLVVGNEVDLYARFDNNTESDVVSGKSIPDEGSASPVENSSVSAPALTATLDPAPETDFGTTEPEWTLTFNRPVAGVTTDDVEEALSIGQSTIETKAVDGSGNVELDVSATTTEGGAIESVSWSVAEPLSDGVNFEVKYVGLFNDIVGAQYGVGVNTSSIESSPLSYSIGANTNAPATPAVGEDGNVQVSNVSETIDYDVSSVSPNLTINVDNSEAPVKEYQVFARTVEDTEDRGQAAPQFDQIETISAENVGFGETSGSVTFSNNPLRTDEGTYGPIEWKVRAVSINNVEGDFSETQEIVDNDSLDLDDANTAFNDTNSDGNADELEVTFSEPVSGISAGDAGSDYFGISDGSGDPTALGSVAEVNNAISPAATATVVVNLGDDGSNTDNDELTVNGESSDNFVMDLAGNPIKVERGANEDDSL